MAKLSLPHERRKAALKSAKLKTQVTIAEQKDRLTKINTELKAMVPARKKKEVI